MSRRSFSLEEDVKHEVLRKNIDSRMYVLGVGANESASGMILDIHPRKSALRRRFAKHPPTFTRLGDTNVLDEYTRIRHANTMARFPTTASHFYRKLLDQECCRGRASEYTPVNSNGYSRCFFLRRSPRPQRHICVTHECVERTECRPYRGYSRDPREVRSVPNRTSARACE